jgi:anti-sigma factor RsiW
MFPTPCQALDEYLAHDLTGEERARFEAHLPMCPSCQRTIREEQSLSFLLSSAIKTLEGVPEDLCQRVQQRLRRTRQQRIVAGVGALAASVIVALLLGRFVLRVPAPAPSPQVQGKQQPPVPGAVPAVEHVRVRFPAGAGVLAVPISSESPHVTVVQVYTDVHRFSASRQDEEADTPMPERSEP